MPPNRAETVLAEEPFDWRCAPRPIRNEALWQRSMNTAPRAQLMLGLQQHVGNQAVQRWASQQRGTDAFEIDADTQARIQRERETGQSLDPNTQASMGRRIGSEFSGVRIHTSAEADDLSHDLKAIAFTVGHDIFFRTGAYDPSSSKGQELLAHELAHVVQQSSGLPDVTDRMKVNAPDDANERAADAVARSVMGQQPARHTSWATTSVQRQEDGELPSGAGDTAEAVIPVSVPSVNGVAELTALDGGDPYHDQAFGKWNYKADALTTADFLAPTFTTSNEKGTPAKGCDGCGDKDCFNVTATATITFDANISVNLPSGSDFSDKKECEQKQIQTAIDTILKPHEQRHVAAFSAYKGTVSKPVQAKVCREDVESGAALTKAAGAIANAEGSTRSASARAASKALDPFEVNVDLKDCEDKQSSDLTPPSDVAVA